MVHLHLQLLAVNIMLLLIAPISSILRRSAVATRTHLIDRVSRSMTTRLSSGGKLRDGTGKPKGYADARLRYVLDTSIGASSGLPRKSDNKPYLVLGIETSCDDTGVAIVSSDGKILSNVVFSQVCFSRILIRSHYTHYQSKHQTHATFSVRDA